MKPIVGVTIRWWVAVNSAETKSFFICFRPLKFFLKQIVFWVWIAVEWQLRTDIFVCFLTKSISDIEYLENHCSRQNVRQLWKVCETPTNRELSETKERISIHAASPGLAFLFLEVAFYLDVLSILKVAAWLTLLFLWEDRSTNASIGCLTSPWEPLGFRKIDGNVKNWEVNK